MYRPVGVYEEHHNFMQVLSCREKNVFLGTGNHRTVIFLQNSLYVFRNVFILNKFITYNMHMNEHVICKKKNY